MSWKLVAFAPREVVTAALIAHEDAFDWDADIVIAGSEIAEDRPDDWQLEAWLPHRPTQADRDALDALFAQLPKWTEERLPGFAPLQVDRAIADGGLISVGNLRLTAHATPGHSPGSTSWTFAACEGRTCRKVAYADSTTSISADGYRFTDHPAYVTAFRDSLDRIATLPCEILVTPHPSASVLVERLAGEKPLVDPTACERYAKAGSERLDQRLADEAAK